MIVENFLSRNNQKGNFIFLQRFKRYKISSNISKILLYDDKLHNF